MPNPERVIEEKKRLEARSVEKPVKPYRSRAEKTAVTQRNVQIFLSLVILAVGIANLFVK